MIKSSVRLAINLTLIVVVILIVILACIPGEFENADFTSETRSFTALPHPTLTALVTIRSTPTMSSPVLFSTETFTPISADMAYVRQGSLWLKNSMTNAEQLIISNTTLVHNVIATAPIWHNNGKWIAYIAYYAEDMVTDQATDRGYLNFVDLEKGRVWHRPDLQVALRGSFAWDLEQLWGYFVGNVDFSVDRPLSSNEQSHYYSFSGRSGIFKVAVPDGGSERLLSENMANGAYTGPIQFATLSDLCYARISSNGLIHIELLNLSSMITTTLGSSTVDAVKVPFAIPTVYLSDQKRVFYLISAPIPDLEIWHGLYSMRGPAGKNHRILELDYSCGLEAGIWQGKIALGCGGAENVTFLICDIDTEICEDVIAVIQDSLLAQIVPEATSLNSLKITPVTWLDSGTLYFIATPYAAGAAWSGNGFLLKYDLHTKNIELLMNNVDYVSFAKKVN